jgi:DNA-binding NarL/FixJ family response regulator
VQPKRAALAIVGGSMRQLRTALIVGTASGHGDAIAPLLEEEWGLAVRRASAFEEGLAGLAPPPDLVLLEVPLRGGAAADFACRAGRLRPAPLQIALGGSAAENEAFALGQAGVHGYLPRPFSTEDLSAALHQALRYEPDLEPIIRTVVGQRGLSEVQQEVRRVMVAEAFARAGSRVGAARLLKVTRQAVQQALRGAGSRLRIDRDVEPRPIAASRASDSARS